MAKDIKIDIGVRDAELRSGLYKALEQAVLDALGGPKTDASGLVVDVGVGRGEMMKRLGANNLECLGIDPEAACVEKASEYGPCKQGGIENLPEFLEGETPAVILCSHVLEHLNSPFDALRIMHKSGAKELVIAVPNLLRTARIFRVLFGKRRGDHPEHIYGWGHAELAAFLERAGYAPLEWYTDRVTMNPFSNRIGTFLTHILKPIEENLLSKIHPTLSSSLIVRCRIKDGSNKSDI